MYIQRVHYVQSDLNSLEYSHQAYSSLQLLISTHLNSFFKFNDIYSLY